MRPDSTDQPPPSRGFIREGFLEIKRKLTRFKLRLDKRRHERARQRALVALGQRAWQEQAGLTPADRESLGQLESQAGSLATELTRLQSEKARLEAHRLNEITGRARDRLAVEAKKRPVDEALRAARAPKEGAAEAVADEASPEIAALAQQSAALQSEIDQIEAAQRAAVGELDGLLAGIHSEMRAKTAATSSVGKEKNERFALIGAALVERRAGEPALAEAIGAVTAIDGARATTDASLEASLAATASMPRGTMLKLFALPVVSIVLVASAVVATPYAMKLARERAAAIDDDTSDEASDDTSDETSDDTDDRPKRTTALPPFVAFSADQVVTEGKEHRTVKLYATEEALRSEGEENGHAFIIILRLDKKVMWTLSPETRKYREVPFDMGERADALRDDSIPSGCKSAGKEKVGDYLCAKEICNVTIGDYGRTRPETRWIAEELGGIAIKLTDGPETVELTNIEVGDQDPDLFDLPDGYDLVE